MSNELDALDPVPEAVKLSTGTVVQLESLRARQFFKFLRIITHGAVPNMRDFSILRMDGDTSAEEFAVRLVSLLALSIPDAEDEAIEFLRSMSKPAGLIEGRRALNKQDQERNAELWAQLDDDLENPELDDLITLIEAIVRREAEDIQALGKRLGAMLNLAEKTGQIPSQSPTSPEANSSGDSPEASTSSPANTTGTTRRSATSRSGGSASASRRSASAASTSAGTESNG